MLDEGIEGQCGLDVKDIGRQVLEMRRRRRAAAGLYPTTERTSSDGRVPVKPEVDLEGVDFRLQWLKEKAAAILCPDGRVRGLTRSLEADEGRLEVERLLGLKCPDGHLTGEMGLFSLLLLPGGKSAGLQRYRLVKVLALKTEKIEQVPIAKLRRVTGDMMGENSRDSSTKALTSGEEGVRMSRSEERQKSVTAEERVTRSSSKAEEERLSSRSGTGVRLAAVEKPLIWLPAAVAVKETRARGGVRLRTGEEWAQSESGSRRALCVVRTWAVAPAEVPQFDSYTEAASEMPQYVHFHTVGTRADILDQLLTFLEVSGAYLKGGKEERKFTSYLLGRRRIEGECPPTPASTPVRADLQSKEPQSSTTTSTRPDTWLNLMLAVERVLEGQTTSPISLPILKRRKRRRRGEDGRTSEVAPNPRTCRGLVITDQPAASTDLFPTFSPLIAAIRRMKKSRGEVVDWASGTEPREEAGVAFAGKPLLYFANSFLQYLKRLYWYCKEKVEGEDPLNLYKYWKKREVMTGSLLASCLHSRLVRDALQVSPQRDETRELLGSLARVHARAHHYALLIRPFLHHIKLLEYRGSLEGLYLGIQSFWSFIPGFLISSRFISSPSIFPWAIQHAARALFVSLNSFLNVGNLLRMEERKRRRILLGVLCLTCFWLDEFYRQLRLRSDERGFWRELSISERDLTSLTSLTASLSAALLLIFNRLRKVRVVLESELEEVVMEPLEVRRWRQHCVESVTDLASLDLSDPEHVRGWLEIQGDWHRRWPALLGRTVQILRNVFKNIKDPEGAVRTISSLQGQRTSRKIQRMLTSLLDKSLDKIISQVKSCSAENMSQAERLGHITNEWHRLLCLTHHLSVLSSNMVPPSPKVEDAIAECGALLNRVSLDCKQAQFHMDTVQELRKFLSSSFDFDRPSCSSKSVVVGSRGILNLDQLTSGLYGAAHRIKRKNRAWRRISEPAQTDTAPPASKGRLPRAMSAAASAYLAREEAEPRALLASRCKVLHDWLIKQWWTARQAELEGERARLERELVMEYLGTGTLRHASKAGCVARQGQPGTIKGQYHPALFLLVLFREYASLLPSLAVGRAKPGLPAVAAALRNLDVPALRRLLQIISDFKKIFENESVAISKWEETNSQEFYEEDTSFNLYWYGMNDAIIGNSDNLKEYMGVIITLANLILFKNGRYTVVKGLPSMKINAKGGIEREEEKRVLTVQDERVSPLEDDEPEVDFLKDVVFEKQLEMCKERREEGGGTEPPLVCLLPAERAAVSLHSLLGPHSSLARDDEPFDMEGTVTTNSCINTPVVQEMIEKLESIEEGWTSNWKRLAVLTKEDSLANGSVPAFKKQVEAWRVLVDSIARYQDVLKPLTEDDVYWTREAAKRGEEQLLKAMVSWFETGRLPARVASSQLVTVPRLSELAYRFPATYSPSSYTQLELTDDGELKKAVRQVRVNAEIGLHQSRLIIYGTKGEQQFDPSHPNNLHSSLTFTVLQLLRGGMASWLRFLEGRSAEGPLKVKLNLSNGRLSYTPHPEKILTHIATSYILKGERCTTAGWRRRTSGLFHFGHLFTYDEPKELVVDSLTLLWVALFKLRLLAKRWEKLYRMWSVERQVRHCLSISSADISSYGQIQSLVSCLVRLACALASITSVSLGFATVDVGELVQNAILPRVTKFLSAICQASLTSLAKITVSKIPASSPTGDEDEKLSKRLKEMGRTGREDLRVKRSYEEEALILSDLLLPLFARHRIAVSEMLRLDLKEFSCEMISLRGVEKRRLLSWWDVKPLYTAELLRALGKQDDKWRKLGTEWWATGPRNFKDHLQDGIQLLPWYRKAFMKLKKKDKELSSLEKFLSLERGEDKESEALFQDYCSHEAIYAFFLVYQKKLVKWSETHWREVDKEMTDEAGELKAAYESLGQETLAVPVGRQLGSMISKLLLAIQICPLLAHFKGHHWQQLLNLINLETDNLDFKLKDLLELGFTEYSEQIRELQSLALNEALMLKKITALACKVCKVELAVVPAYEGERLIGYYLARSQPAMTSLAQLYKGFKSLFLSEYSKRFNESMEKWCQVLRLCGEVISLWLGLQVRLAYLEGQLDLLSLSDEQLALLARIKSDYLKMTGELRKERRAVAWGMKRGLMKRICVLGQDLDEIEEILSQPFTLPQQDEWWDVVTVSSDHSYMDAPLSFPSSSGYFRYGYEYEFE